MQCNYVAGLGGIAFVEQTVSSRVLQSLINAFLVMLLQSNNIDGFDICNNTPTAVVKYQPVLSLTLLDSSATILCLNLHSFEQKGTQQSTSFLPPKNVTTKFWFQFSRQHHVSSIQEVATELMSNFHSSSVNRSHTISTTNTTQTTTEFHQSLQQWQNLHRRRLLPRQLLL